MQSKKEITKIILTALAIGLVGFFASVLFLQPIFSGRVVLGQNIQLGGLRIQYYGIIMGLAVIAAYSLVNRKMRIEEKDAENIYLIVLISGFVGARLYHVISEIPLYVHQPLQAFAVWNGGLSIFGALLGGLAGLAIYLHSTRKYSLSLLLDWLIPGVALGQIIGRFGNLVNYELYGNPTNLPWKMFVPARFRLPPHVAEMFFHPLFLYEAAGSLVILLLLLRLKLRPGGLFLLWLFLYNGMRFFLEFLRVGSITYGHLRINAIVALVLVLIALIYWYRIKNTHADAV